MSKNAERLLIIRLYREETGEIEVDMRMVAEFALRKGWPLPKPADPMDILTKQFSDAARHDVRHDDKTGRPYRGNHAVPHSYKGQLTFFWMDIDDPRATKSSFDKSVKMRREQMVDDGVQLSFDLDHWNSLRPDPKDQVTVPWDLTMDIEIRRAAYDYDKDEKTA